MNAFSCNHTLAQHQRILTRERCFMCNEHGKVFSRSCRLSIRKFTLEKELLNLGIFNNNSHLIEHQRGNSRDRHLECMECGKSFTQSSNLITHRRAHTRERPYERNKYGKSIRHISKLKHPRIHAGETSYECSECEKSFAANCLH